MSPLTPPSPAGRRSPHSDDESLVRACIAGDRAAWEQLVDRYAGLVYSIPRRFGLADAACDDVFQAVFLQTLRRLPSLRDCRSLPKWLITTTRRECWRTSRRAAPAPAELSDSLPDHAAAVEADAIAWERRELVNQGLARLGGRCEELLRLLFLDRSDLSYVVIARRLNIPVGTIGPVRARCLKKLLEIMGDADTG